MKKGRNALVTIIILYIYINIYIYNIIINFTLLWGVFGGKIQFCQLLGVRSVRFVRFVMAGALKTVFI